MELCPTLRCLVFRKVLLDDQVVDDEVLTFHGVLAHVVLQELLYLVVLVKGYLLQPHIRAYEVDELIGTYLSKSFESRYLRVRSEVADGVQTLFLGVAVARYEVALALLLAQAGVSLGDNLLVFYLCAFVADTEQWRLQHIDVAFLYQLRIELKEEGYKQETDVHAVDIGIGGNDNLVVAQVVETVLDVEGSLEKCIRVLVLADTGKAQRDIHHIYMGKAVALRPDIR